MFPFNPTPNPYDTMQELFDHAGDKMDDDDRIAFGCCNMAATLTVLFLTLIICALLGSCGVKERVVTVTAHTTDTLRIVQHQRDSIYLHDSIHVSERGDTVRIERWHTSYRDRWHRDTVYQATHDTIPQPYEVLREVPAKLTWWQRARLAAVNIVLAAMALYGGMRILRSRMRR